MTSLALTGHRPQKLAGFDMTRPFYRRLQDEMLRIGLRELARRADPRQALTFHSGMALGADTLWAEAALMLKARHPEHVRLVAHVPMPQQPDRWPQASQNHYRELLARADRTLFYGAVYSSAVMQRRNVGLVDACDVLVAVFDGVDRGGTAGAVRYARSIGKPIIQLDPAQFTTS